ACLAAEGRALADAASREPLGYRIGPEDVLQVAVWKNETLSRTVPVRPDGMISLPLLNDVQAAGLTPMELRDALVKKLVEYTPSPEVSVIVAEVHSFKVSVVGAVERPGRFDTRTWVTVLDALALAGGFTEFADRSRVVVLRAEGGATRRIPFDYTRLDREKDAQPNFHLCPGDIIVVP
ncbi:MAG TPA: polysaccharide biosynthesis/export family protein, partial [Vicinamibacteria bacterium]|nr:polysaccharide biosynthesis/export family protein [Vicinamibacteria bacterium]